MKIAIKIIDRALRGKKIITINVLLIYTVHNKRILGFLIACGCTVVAEEFTAGSVILRQGNLANQQELPLQNI